MCRKRWSILGRCEWRVFFSMRETANPRYSLWAKILSVCFTPKNIVSPLRSARRFASRVPSFSEVQMTCLPSPCGRLSRPLITMEAPSPCASRQVGDPVFRHDCTYQAHCRRPTHSLQWPCWSSSILQKEQRSYAVIAVQDGIDFRYGVDGRTPTPLRIGLRAV